MFNITPAPVKDFSTKNRVNPHDITDRVVCKILYSPICQEVAKIVLAVGLTLVLTTTRIIIPLCLLLGSIAYLALALDYGEHGDKSWGRKLVTRVNYFLLVRLVDDKNESKK